MSTGKSQKQFEKEVHHLINSCIERFGHVHLRRIMKSIGLPSGMGRLDTLGTMMDYVQHYDCTHELNALRDEYHRHVFFGDKAIQFYQVSSENMAFLVSVFQQFEPDSVFTKAYPLPLSSERLRENYKSNKAEPQPTSKEQDGLSIIFSSVRYFSMQFELKPGNRSDSPSFFLQPIKI